MTSLIVIVGPGACSSMAATQAEHAALPVGARLERSGFATILEAPASPAIGPEATGSDTESNAADRDVRMIEAEALRNPDEAATRDAMVLDQRLRAAALEDYVGVRIVRNPDPRFAFQFRRDATATLARFTSDGRFIAMEGGVPPAELQSLFDAWLARFQPHDIFGSGSVMEFDGVAEFHLTIDAERFQTLAAHEGWAVPETVKLHFPPPINARSVDPIVAPWVRVFARQNRAPGVVLQAALNGRLILRDGCFRMRTQGGEPLVLFGRDVELGLDDDGYMVVSDPLGVETPIRKARVGERVIWSGPRGVNEADAGVQALRANCGQGPVIAVGEPVGEKVFEQIRQSFRR